MAQKPHNDSAFSLLKIQGTQAPRLATTAFLSATLDKNVKNSASFDHTATSGTISRGNETHKINFKPMTNNQTQAYDRTINLNGQTSTNQNQLDKDASLTNFNGNQMKSFINSVAQMEDSIELSSDDENNSLLQSDDDDDDSDNNNHHHASSKNIRRLFAKSNPNQINETTELPPQLIHPQNNGTMQHQTANNAMESDSNKKQSQLDIVEGMELMLKQLQEQAKMIETMRYCAVDTTKKNLSTKFTAPMSIITQSKCHKGNTAHSHSIGLKNSQKSFKQGSFDRSMNWWDKPFRDHLHEAKRPIVRECGIEQFASEYMIAQLRNQEQQLLQARQQIEFERTRPATNNWYEMKSSSFSNELRRFNRNSNAKF